MSGDGKGQVGHVGGVHLRLLAERVGLTGALSAALARPGFVPVHDRGQVMVDLAVAITLGATCIRDIRLLEHQRPVFGPVASFPTAWRALVEVGELGLRRIERARTAVRRHVQGLLRDRPEGFPEVEVEGVPLTGWTVIDSDGTLIAAPSEKEGAHGTYKGFLGHHVFVATCDNTGEELAAVLHPGNVTANDAAVNIDVLTRAVAQLPWWRRQKILFRVDGAGFSHQLIDWIASAGGR
ncbi:transposase, partial [Streptomyces sp. NPDC051286]|uniref:transposase n=1 Tax=Streptomyces sp. NPDC051286 TaxID=3365647 RepID=UPI0037B96403